MKICRKKILAFCIAAVSSFHLPVHAAAPSGTIFDPDGGGYTSLGTLVFTSGTLTFDTTALTLTDSTLGLIGSGAADTSLSGLVQMAVFNFQSLTIQTGVTVVITGDRGLALTSRTNLTLGAAISLNGGVGSGTASTADQPGGSGAPGAEGGVRNSGVSSSAPPPATAGDGGTGKFNGTTAITADNGVGLGAGSGATHAGAPASNGGGGGSYGGVGGTGAMANTAGTAGAGGNAYGDMALTDLFGGSGGGGGVKQSALAGGGGGGGGGSIALIAEGTIFISGSILAKGGAGGIQASTTNNPTGGGGGSGGGILLAADAIDFTGTLDARGGNGGANSGTTSDRPGGGGGGGRIALYANTLSGNTPTSGSNVLLAGGTTETNSVASTNATAGAIGTLSQSTAPSYLAVPEPGSALLALCGGATLLLRRTRRR